MVKTGSVRTAGPHNGGIMNTSRPRLKPFFLGMAFALLLVAGVGTLWRAAGVPLDLGLGPQTFDASERRIHVSPGDEFAVEVKANPSTGYEWVVEPPEADVVERLGKEYEGDSDELVGSGGTLRLRFRAVADGLTQMTLRHCFRCGTPQEETDEVTTLYFRIAVRG